jgi:hypothetical protein
MHDADRLRQSSFDGTLHELGREERERDDLANAAWVAEGIAQPSHASLRA